MSYPKAVDKFIPWSKAMVAGATVDKPHYPGTIAARGRKYRKKRKKRRKRNHGSKD